MSTLQYHMNRLAGTLNGNVPTRDAQGAANVWAGTTGKDLVGALNVKAGNSLPNYRDLAGVLNQLAGTTGLGVAGAAAAVTGVITPTAYTFRYADSNATRMTEALTVNPTTGQLYVIASAGRIWAAPATLSTTETNVFTSGTQLTVTGDVTGASWSPDGTKVAVITRSENVYIFNSSWVQQSTFVVPQAGGNTEAICWSADGTEVFWCYDNSAGTGSALYRAVPGGAQTLVGTLPPGLSQLSGLTASPTHPDVLYGVLDWSSSGDATIKVIDATDATLIGSIETSGATNVDWEDIELSGYDGSVWVGDHGNYGGGASLGSVTHTLYNFPEPTSLPTGG